MNALSRPSAVVKPWTFSFGTSLSSWQLSSRLSTAFLSMSKKPTIWTRRWGFGEAVSQCVKLPRPEGELAARDEEERTPPFSEKSLVMPCERSFEGTGGQRQVCELLIRGGRQVQAGAGEQQEGRTPPIEPLPMTPHWIDLMLMLSMSAMMSASRGGKGRGRGRNGMGVGGRAMGGPVGEVAQLEGAPVTLPGAGCVRRTP